MSDTASLDDLIPEAVDKPSSLDDLVPPDHPALQQAPPPPADDKVADDVKQAASPDQIARANLAPDPNTQLKRYAAMYKQPESDFRVVGDKVERKVPETGTWAYVEPTFWGKGDRLGRAERWAASGAGQAIPIIAGATGTAGGAALGIESGPGAFATAMGSGAAGAAAGEVGREKLDTKLANDPDTPIDWWNVAAQAAQAGVTEPASWAMGKLGGLAARMPGVRTILAKYGLQTEKQLQALEEKARQTATAEHPLGFLPPQVLKDIGDQLGSEWDHMMQVTQDAKDMGIDTLSVGQRTNSPVLKRIERWLAGTPEGAEKFGRTRQLQMEQQVPGAVNQTLDEIAPKPTGNPVEEFRAGADKIVKNAADKQAKAADTAYKVALDDPAKPLDFNDKLRSLFQRPIMREAWERAQEQAANRGQTLPKFIDFDPSGAPKISDEIQPTWRSIDQIKRGLDDIMNKPENQNRFGVPTGKGADARQLKQELLGIVDPQNPAYAAARGQFGTSADAIDQILKGGVGQLQKMTGPDRVAMLDKTFRGGRQDLMADDVGEVRQLFEKAGLKTEWRQGLRAFLEDGLDESMRVKENGGETGNVAGKMLQYWGTDRQRQVLRAALGDPQLADKLSRTMDVMRAASRLLPEGSPTAPNAELAKATGNKLLRSVSSIYGLATGHGLVDKGLDALEKHLASVAEPEARRALAEYMLNPGSVQSIRSFLSGMPTQRAIAASPQARTRAAAQIGRLLTAAGVPVTVGAGAAAVDNLRGD